MTSRVVRLFVTWTCLTSVAGCQFPRGLTREEVESSSDDIQVRTVTLLDGREIDFRSDPLGYAFIRDSVLVRSMKDGSFVEIPIDSIQLGESTRHPTAQENALNNLLLGSAVVILVAYMGAQLASIDFH